jgi:predicted protein tyrosine phosphatase
LGGAQVIKSKLNQMANANNKWQNDDKRVLCVCSAGLLRSPTLAQYLQQKYGYNTRACGTSEEYALIPISEALVHWADLVIFVNEENYDEVKGEEIFSQKEVIVLDLPDEFGRNQPGLLAAIEEQWAQHEGQA